MAVDFCLHTNTAFDDLSLSAARRDAHRTSIGEIIRRGAKVIQIGGIGKYDLCADNSTIINVYICFRLKQSPMRKHAKIK